MAEYAFRLRNWQTGAVLSDISTVLADPEGLYRVCRPSQWTGVVDLQSSLAAPLRALSTSLEVEREGVSRFHGFTWRVHRKGTLDDATAECLWVDPLRAFLNRRVRDAFARLAKPVFEKPITGGELLRQVMANSEAFEAGGAAPLPLLFGSDSTTVDMSLRLASTPARIAELALILGASGRCDHWVTPRVDLPGKLGELHCFDRAGTDRSAAVRLKYGEGGNCDAAEFIEDAEQICTALSYWLGPKYDDQHWRGNVQRDDPNLPSPPQAALAALITAARALYGYWSDDRFFDDLDDIGEPGVEDDDPLEGDRPAWRRLWQLEQYFRLGPRLNMDLTPSGGAIAPWDDFFLGDKVWGEVPGLGVSDAGAQRVYGFAVSPGNDNVEQVKLITSNKEAQ